jgi:hypothetical protein
MNFPGGQGECTIDPILTSSAASVSGPRTSAFLADGKFSLSSLRARSWLQQGPPRRQKFLIRHKKAPGQAIAEEECTSPEGPADGYYELLWSWPA